MGGLSGGFDAPHTANVSYNTEGSGVGSLREPPVAEQKDSNSNGLAVPVNILVLYVMHVLMLVIYIHPRVIYLVSTSL